MRPFKSLILIAAAAVFVSAGPVTPSGAMGKDARAQRNEMFRLVNASRRNHGVHPLKLNWNLSTDAYRHTQRMVRRNSLYHTSDLYSLVRRYRPRTWGENVGMGGTLKRMEHMFMASPPHRANILNPAFKKIGVGVQRARGYLWVTLDFYG
ncbi:MAG TPA: CAP domain-containing protein [Actinomycetota bacterium]